MSGKKFIILFLLSPLWVTAQDIHHDTIRQLPEVEIGSARVQNFTNGNKIIPVDSSAHANAVDNNLSDLLNEQGLLLIKSYGPGSLATTSFRGAGAEQTAVLWNGFNLQSPMHGQLDLALVPAGFIDNIQLQYGGASALHGSGAVGGTILLNNAASFGNGTTVSVNEMAASFDHYRHGLNFSYSGSRFINSTKFFYESSQNNFPFNNVAQFGKPLEYQNNAHLQQKGVLQEFYFLINEKQMLNIHSWYQYSNRQIPPTMTTDSSRAVQIDDTWRTTAEWKRKGEMATWFIRSALFYEKLSFFDPAYNVHSHDSSLASISEIETKITLPHHQLFNIGINGTSLQAGSKEYSRRAKQFRSAVFASYKISSADDRWRVTASIREEILFRNDIALRGPLVPSAGFEGMLWKGFSIKGNVSRNYRLPTFNDLYWSQGGNINLLPEEGWSGDAGLVYNFNNPSTKITSFNIQATAFNSNINQWIIWLPNQYAIWTPTNLAAVWARGAETEAALKIKASGAMVNMSARYHFVLSTNVKSVVLNDPSLDKQLIYVPQHKAQAQVSVSFHEIFINYIFSYTGFRYITSDNTQYLNPFWLSDVQLVKKISFNKCQVLLRLQANNIFDVAYQVIAWRAMPPRNYQAGIVFQFHQPLNKQLTNN